jgi:hypothetical protein
MDIFTIRLKRRFWLDKVLKKVKGTVYPDDMNPAVEYLMVQEDGKTAPHVQRRNPVKFMLVIFEDERRLVVNLDKYQGYEISKELFYIQAKQAEQESQGQAKVA